MAFFAPLLLPAVTWTTGKVLALVATTAVVTAPRPTAVATLIATRARKRCENAEDGVATTAVVTHTVTRTADKRARERRENAEGGVLPDEELTS